MLKKARPKTALYEGSEITGALLPEVAKAWGMAAARACMAPANGGAAAGGEGTSG